MKKNIKWVLASFLLLIMPIKTNALVYYDTPTSYTMNSPEIKQMIVEMEKEQTTKNTNFTNTEKLVDIVIFAGQSNMVGQGDPSDPTIPSMKQSGFEMVFDSQNKAYGVKYLENSMNLRKSLIPAFANSYYNNTGVPIIAIQTAVSGSHIDEWQVGDSYYEIAKEKLQTSIKYIEEHPNNFKLRNIYFVWYQGETDEPTLEYQKGLTSLLENMKNLGVNQTFLIRIGHLYRATGTSDDKMQETKFNKYTEMIKLQTEFTRKSNLAVLISTKAAALSLVKGPATTIGSKPKISEMMGDQVHPTQLALNIIGSDAGKNAAYYANEKKEPNLLDLEYKTGIHDFYYTGFDPSASLNATQSSFFYTKSVKFMSEGNKSGVLQYGILAKHLPYKLQSIYYESEMNSGLKAIYMEPFQKGNYIALDCSGYAAFIFHYIFGLPFDYTYNNVPGRPWTTEEFLNHPQSLKYGTNTMIDTFKYVGELKSDKPEYTLYSAVENFTLRTGDLIIGKNQTGDAHIVIYMGINKETKNHIVMNSTSVAEHNIPDGDKKYHIGQAFLTKENFGGAQNFSHEYKTITVLRLNNEIIPDNLIGNSYDVAFSTISNKTPAYKFEPTYIPGTQVITDLTWTKQINK